ncbi:MAG: adenylate/guanylate cyclase domain-containing protein, partial [Gemmatimonadota bacterium]
DPEVQVAIRLLMEIFPAAFLSGSGNLFPYLVLKSVNLSLCHGNSPESAFAYAAYGMLLCGALNDPALGFEYGKLAVAMNEKFDDIALKSRIIYLYTMFIHHWNRGWASMTPWFLKGIEAGYQSGDLLYLAYSAQDCIIWDPTLDLETASEEQRKYLAIVRDCDYQDSLDSGTLFLQMQLNFQGLTDGLYSLNDGDFDEARCVEGMRRRRFMTGIANYHIYKAEIHFFYGDYAGALEHIQAQDALIESSMSLPQLVRFYIVAFLTRAALYPESSAAEHEAVFDGLQAYLRQMAMWADNCPENFDHLRLVMEAEMARLADRMTEALGLYERAIAAAKDSGFRRDEALANELAARYLSSAGLSKAAEGYLSAAHYLYYRWGARRKVEQLEEQYSHMLHPAVARGGSSASRMPATTTRSLDSASLDMSSVVKASQTMSGEIDVGQLLKTTIQIVLENAGGQKGYFVVREGEELVIRALGEGGRDGSARAARIPVQVPGEGPALPVTLVNSVLRTGAPLVLHDAAVSSRFATDPYIIEHQPKSVICIPIRRHGNFRAAIYMENNLTTGAFTEERVEIVNLLSAQASISMENARLFEDQLRLTEAQQRFVPSQFLESLGHHDIAQVGLGEHVAREMTVMFADLRGFTSLAERLGPRAVIGLLNRYFSRLSKPVTEAGGFIDSYNGDEIMALFGLSADLAVEAGVRMWRALEEFNRESVAGGGLTLTMGVGVNTGPLVLGTVGAQDRLQCGVVGDSVNVASRIEQLTKLYNARFLIGEGTYKRLATPGKFSLRMVDRVAVKGKEQGIRLYEVLDAETSERRAAKEATRDLLTRAMERYFARDFAAAHGIFTEILALDPEDAVLSIFAERSKRYSEYAPPPDWQGFEALKHK